VVFIEPILSQEIDLRKYIFALFWVDRQVNNGIIYPFLSIRTGMMMNCIDMDEVLTWEDTYAIARALIHAHPEIDLVHVSLRMIYEWTLALPGFCDDAALANDLILSAIYQEWFEEVNPI
jgi:FeS assembly protein IscX